MVELSRQKTTKEKTDIPIEEEHECCLCLKKFKGKVIYTLSGKPVCSWKCLYKEIRKEYKKILAEPLIINQPKKRGRKNKSDGQELGKEQKKEKTRYQEEKEEV